MKKILLVISILAITAGNVSGQFSFGLKLGYNSSKLHIHLDSIVSTSGSGLHFGAFFRIGVSERVYLQPEIYYTLQGGQLQNEAVSAADNWEQKITVGTVDVPLIVGFKIIHTKAFNWRIMAGPMVSFLVNSKIKDMNDLVTGPVRDADLAETNWYVQAGSGFDIFFVTLDVRYQAGLNQMIRTAQRVDPNGNATGQNYPLNGINNLWVVSLGFKL